MKQKHKDLLKKIVGQQFYNRLYFTKWLNKDLFPSGHFAVVRNVETQEDGLQICKVTVTGVQATRPFTCEMYSDRGFLVSEIFSKKYLLGLFPHLKKHFEAKGIRNPSVIDCGANVGFFIKVFSQYFPKLTPKFYAFEPLKANRTLLERNMKKIRGKVTIEPVALGSEVSEGRDMFLVSTTGATISREQFEAYKPFLQGREVPVIQVPVITLDQYTDRNLANEPVHLIKLDVEGAEEEILTGAANLLKRDRPAVLCSYEHLKNDPRVVRKLLSAAGRYTEIEHKPTKMILYMPE